MFVYYYQIAYVCAVIQPNGSNYKSVKAIEMDAAKKMSYKYPTK